MTVGAVSQADFHARGAGTVKAYIVSKRSDMDHTVLPANYTMPAFP